MKIYNLCRINQLERFQTIAAGHPVRIEGLSLFAHGFAIHWISSVSVLAMTADYEALLQIANVWAPSDPSGLYFTDETKLEAFLRTVIADMAGGEETDARGGRVC
jgi:hypothetical protein